MRVLGMSAVTSMCDTSISVKSAVPASDHFGRGEVDALNISVGRGIQFGIIEFVLVGLQLDAQLFSDRQRLFS